MPKLKTHKGLSKRVKVTAKGKVKARKSFAGHLMSGKTANKRRKLRNSMIVSGATASRIKVLVGEN